MGQPCRHRSQPALRRPPSPLCQHAIHHDSLPSGPHRSKPSSSHLHTPPTSRSAQPVAAPVRCRSRPPPRPAPDLLPCSRTKGSSSETTCENFLYCYQGFTHVRPSPPGGWLPPQGRERHRFPPVF